MPTYNGEKYIKEQICSILIQLGPNDELIISDDGSQDSTLSIIENFKDSRISVYNACFHSPIYNVENAMKKAKGDVIFLADQDDVWFPNKVKLVMEKMRDFDCVVSDAVVVDANMNVIHESFYKLNHTKPGMLHNLVKNGYLGCCMAFNRKILDKSLPFPNPIPMHDPWIGLVAEKFGETFFLNQPLIYYRRHGNNASPTAGKSNRSLLLRFQDRYLFLKNILVR